MRQLKTISLLLCFHGVLWAQTYHGVINLGECSFNLRSPADPPPASASRDGLFQWYNTPPAPVDPGEGAGWYCLDENEADTGAGVDKVYRVESTYRGRVYGCPENETITAGTQACMYHEICNFNPPNTPACIPINHDGSGSLSDNTKNEDGDGLFTISDVRSPCFIETSGASIDLTTIEPNDVQFDPGVLGIEQHCRDLLSLYQNQLSRSGGVNSHDTFSLSTSYTTPP